MKLVYNLDGFAEHEQGHGPRRRGDGAGLQGHMGWRQDHHHYRRTPNGEIKRVVSMEGANMVIETTAPGREGGAPTTTKAVYKKA